MFVKLTYLLVIFIWATTPLSIKLGGDTLSPMAALSLRIALAFMVGSAVCTLFGLAGLSVRRNGKLYFAASISLFPNMALVYMATQHISSGLVSLLFGLSPFFTLLLAKPILGENLIRPRKLLALSIAALGLGCIVFDKAALSGDGLTGIGLMLVSNILFSGSALWVKKLNAELSVPPFEQALGAMAFALPGMLLSWVFVVGVEPIVFSPVSLASLLYLALFASLVGFAAYYFILREMSVEAVSLIPLITPVLAMSLGVLVNNEAVSVGTVVGAGLILLGLAVHAEFDPRRRFRRKPMALTPERGQGTA
ncbi:DMT family transporter [Spongiibacter tropicus]|uniref:DMT family transporter n=1 Tax=Spongiibacter tropicus TaxID=454602 RepID=UPI0035BE71DF